MLVTFYTEKVIKLRENREHIRGLEWGETPMYFIKN